MNMEEQQKEIQLLERRYDEAVDILSYLYKQAKEGCIVWHDLAKNPSDLPGNARNVLCTVRYEDDDEFLEILHYVEGKREWLPRPMCDERTVEAWRDVEMWHRD